MATDGRAPAQPGGEPAGAAPALSGKQRMLNAYRGRWNDRVAVAPEFWYYYPAKVLGVDMIRFSREVPFQQALKTTFERFACEGWGVTFAGIPNPQVSGRSTDTWLDADTLEVRHVTTTPLGELSTVSRLFRTEPGWVVERPLRDLRRDLPAWELATLGGDPEAMDCSGMVKAWREVGESYLLEAWLGVPFFDVYAGARGFEDGVADFLDPDLRPHLLSMRDRYLEQLVHKAAVVCRQTAIESVCIGCSWSCNSLEGPRLWREWDKPVIAAVAREVHRHGRLLHIHFHGRCFETVADFAELGVDCVCPFERPPGGDVDGREGLATVERLLRGRTTMNGNVHTVETLIRGTPDTVRAEVRQILEAFRDNPRLIVGTGDQVGLETPEENLVALVDEVRRWPLPSGGACPAAVQP